MTTVTFITHDEQRYEIETSEGTSVMLAAVQNQVPGILGECGGSLACATCHVYVAPEWIEKCEPASDFENEMLDMTVSERREGSRLCCQITLSPALNGIVVQLPESQI